MSIALTQKTDQLSTDSTASRATWWRTLSDRIEDSSGLSSLCAIADQGLISGTNFVTAVVIGRCCGAGTLGLYALVTSGLAMVVGIQDQLVTAPYVLYHNRKRGDNLKKYRGSVLLHQGILTAAAMIIFSAFLLLMPARSAEAQTTGLILLIATPGLLLRAFVREMALAHYKVARLLLLDTWMCCCQLATVVLMLVTGSANLISLYAFVGIASVVSISLWWSKLRQSYRFDRRATKVSWSRNWRFGRWALATHLAGCSTPYVMPWVLFAMKGERETGLLASASVIVGIANILLSGLADFLTPRAARAYATGGVTRLRSILRSMLGISTLAIGSVCVVAVFFGQQIVDTLYDGRFANVGLLISLLTFSVLANAIGNVAGNGLWAFDQPRTNFVADMMTLVVAIASAPVLIRPYGATGAAMSTLIACSMGATVRQMVFLQSARQRQRQAAVSSAD